MKKLAFLFAFLMMFSIFCGCTEPKTENEKAYGNYVAKAEELTDKINEFFLAEGDLGEKYYKEYMNEGAKAYLWSQFSLTGKQYAYCKANPEDEDARNLLLEQIDMFERYVWTGSTETFRKYHSGQGLTSGNGTIYFDDNIWGARNFLFAYEISKDTKYLDKAKAVVEFVYTGWDDKLGGLVWNETGLTGGNAADLERGLSANGASVFVSAELYQITGEQKYLDWALRFYDFCKTIQDPETHFYYNGRHTVINSDGTKKDGGLNKAAYSYNPGSMIIADLYLYEITKDEKYLTDAKLSAKAAFDVFAFPEESMGVTFINDFQWFNTVLLDAYVRLYPYDNSVGEYIKAFESQLNYAYNKKRNEKGLLPEKYYDSGWDNTQNKENYRLLIQAANAEQFSLVAWHYLREIEREKTL